MASRKEQKERARAERLAAERAAAAKSARSQRVRFAGGGTLGLVAVAAIVIAIASGGGSSNGAGSPIQPAASGVKLPAAKLTSLPAAVRAAGCTTIDTPDTIARSDQNRTHVSPGTKVAYATNPPTYGPHYPSAASDGEYKSNGTPAMGYLVHAMEHGRIEYQYQTGLPKSDVKQLEALFNEGDGQWTPGQLLLLFQNQSHMPYEVAATAWGHVLGCKTFSPPVLDALRDFRLAYTNKGPEQLGTGPE